MRTRSRSCARPIIAYAVVAFAWLTGWPDEAAVADSGPEFVPEFVPEADVLWAVGMAAQFDDASSSSGLVSFSLGLRERTWVNISAGRSRSPSDRADVSLRSASAGIDHRFGQLGVTFSAGLWGDPDALESTELRGGLYLQRDRFRIGYERERRDLDLTFSVAGQQGGSVTRQLGLVGTADALRARVELAQRWQLFVTTRHFDYSRDLAVLPRIAQLNLLSTSPLTLAYGFLDYEHSISVEWQLGARLISLTGSRDRSAADRSRMTTVSGGVMLPIARRVDMEITLGRGRWGGSTGDVTTVAGSSRFGGLLFLVYGGG